MFVQSLPGGSRHSLALLGDSGLTASFYLAGGTAAALNLGHRISVDLDFFDPDPFDSHELARQLSELGQFRLDRLAPDTLIGELEGVRVSIFRYRYPLIAEPVHVLGVTVVGLADIAAMKIDAISTRGIRRDFVDLYFIVQAGVSIRRPYVFTSISMLVST